MTQEEKPSRPDSGEHPEDEKPRYKLRLCITGTTSLSARAIVNVRKICEEHLHGQYELEVIDLIEHPEVAAREQVIAAPTLVKSEPPPTRRFIGDMSQSERILRGLGLPADDPPRTTDDTPRKE